MGYNAAAGIVRFLILYASIHRVGHVTFRCASVTPNSDSDFRCFQPWASLSYSLAMGASESVVRPDFEAMNLYEVLDVDENATSEEIKVVILILDLR